jgi:hypothetical protein
VLRVVQATDVSDRRVDIERSAIAHVTRELDTAE